jgi:uncharacterized damage-inducible protein DinB
MDEKSQKTLKITEFKELSPRVALWYRMMHEARERLHRVLENLTQKELNYTPNERKIESIGTLLLHIAGVEWSWIFQDIDGHEMDYEEFKHGFPLRPEVNIPQLKNQEIQFYVSKLNKIREDVYQRLARFEDEDLDRLVESDSETYSIEWILFHILEHEAMHIGQIQLLRRLYSEK